MLSRPTRPVRQKNEVKKVLKVPFVSFLPLERELNDALRGAFERVFERSWYIQGAECEAFEKAFAEYCETKYCIGVGMLNVDADKYGCPALAVGNDASSWFVATDTWFDASCHDTDDRSPVPNAIHPSPSSLSLNE